MTAILAAIAGLFPARLWIYLAIAAAVFTLGGTSAWKVQASRIDRIEAQHTKAVGELKAEVQSKESTIAQMNALARLESEKLKKVAHEKTIQYQAEVAKNKELFARFNAAMLSKSELDKRLSDIESQYRLDSTSTSASGFSKRLGAAYSQCERDLSEALDAASRANQGLANATAGLRALQILNDVR